MGIIHFTNDGVDTELRHQRQLFHSLSLTITLSQHNPILSEPAHSML